ncbi:hypothetical protein [Roseibium sp.]|uniref:hypothetical protein n=1 Tax=Roseibium sp. TaxID=1936156 RepID=UPI003BA8E787
MANSKGSQTLDIQSLSQVDPRILEDALKNSRENERVIELEAEVARLKAENDQLLSDVKKHRADEKRAQDAVRDAAGVLQDYVKKMNPVPRRYGGDPTSNSVNQFGTNTQVKIRRVAQEKGVPAEDIVAAYKAGTFDLDKEIEDITGNKAPVKRSRSATSVEVGAVIAQVQGNMPA